MNQIGHPSEQCWSKKEDLFKEHLTAVGIRLPISQSNGGQYGGLFGYTEGAVIKSCNVTGEVNGYNCTGGIVGYANNNTHILNCSFQGNVEGNGQDRGGIVGSTSIGCDVSGCFVTGTVTGGNCVGGIAGNGVGTIKNCYALANVTATGVNAGGIAGKRIESAGCPASQNPG